MSGGFLQLAAKGEEDIYLTGNPQITFFVSVYKRYTNFSIENIRQYFEGEADFGKKVYCKLESIGDLISDIYLHVKLPSLINFNSKIKESNIGLNEDDSRHDLTYHWINYVGHALINYVEIEIGGVVIDKHYGIWLQIWSELTMPDEKKQGYYDMIGYSSYNTSDFYFKNQTEYDIYVPLNFWFCRDRGLALPIIAIQHQEVRINMVFRKAEDLIIRKNCSINNIGLCNDFTNLNNNNNNNNVNFDMLKIRFAELYVDYIFLEDHERRYFINSEHEYLIEQVQMNTNMLYSRGTRNVNIDNETFTQERCEVVNGKLGPDCAPHVESHKVEINFKHPVKELIWVFNSSNLIEKNEDNNYQGNEWFNFGINTYPNCYENKDENLYAYSDTNSLINNSLNNYITNNDNLDECIDNDLIQGKTINHDYGINPSNISPMNDATLYIEGKERMEKREYQYYKLIQPYQRHTNVPLDWIYVYSFAFEPEKITPTGTCNFSKIDNSHFVFNISKYLINPQLNIFATNYNIIVIKNGHCGVMYK